MSNSKNNQDDYDVQCNDDDSQLVNDLFPYVETSIGRMLLLLPQSIDTVSGRFNSTNDRTLSSLSQRFSLEVNQTNTSCSIQIIENCIFKSSLYKSDTSIHPMTIVNDMIQLALECDRFLYHDTGQDSTNRCTQSLAFSPTVNGLLSLSNEQKSIPNNASTLQSENFKNSTSNIIAVQDTNVYITVATILALNLLESTIRKIVHEKSSKGNGSGSGGAPLLRHMIEQLPSCCDKNNVSVQKELYTIQTLLKGLLLPTGLNLRNLLWHGFVGSNIPRPWLSLVLIIIHQLESISKNNNDHHNTSTIQNATINQSMTASSSTCDNNLDYALKESQLIFPLLRIKQNHPCFSNVVDQGTRLRIEFTKSYETKSDTIPSRVVQTNETTTNPINVSCDTRNHHHIFDATNVIRSIIPRTHLDLWDFCLYQINTTTASSNKHYYDSIGSKVADLQRWSEATKRGRPIIISIILTILMEHALRLLYCQVNVNRIHDDCIARFGSYYITLDGHGQQHQHDLILYPYQLHNIPFRSQTAIHQCIDSDSSGTTTDNKGADTNIRLSKRSQLSSTQPMEENKLIEFLGVDVIALLTDLFVSGTGGPNLRAAMAHGLWDDCIQHEIVHTTTLFSYLVDTDDANKMLIYPQNGWEIVDVLLASFAQIAMSVHSHSNTTATTDTHNFFRYRPSYSFTSSTLRSLQNDFSVLVDTRTIINLIEADPESINGIPESVISRVLRVLTACQFKEAFENVVVQLSINKNASTSIPQQKWSIADTNAEYEMNKVLEPLGATRQLLLDILVAVQSLNDELQKVYDSRRIQTFQHGQRTESTRQRNRAKRIAACSEFAHDLYSFALIIAVFSIQNGLSRSGLVEASCRVSTCLNDKEWVKVIERTRMVLSTFSNFLLCNIDRSFKAADQYIKGSLVQKVIAALKVHEEELCE